MIIKPKGDYATARAAAYPPIEDQLDSLWHAMDQGLMPKIEPMYSSIKATKSKFPKAPAANEDLDLRSV